jgi:cysteine desulfurase
MDGVRALRDLFWDEMRQRWGEAVVLNGHPERRLPNTLNVSFIGHRGAELLQRLEGVAASTGSACHSGQDVLSPVLSAMHVPLETGLGAIRFSLGRATTAEEIQSVLERLARILGRTA